MTRISMVTNIRMNIFFWDLWIAAAGVRQPVIRQIKKSVQGQSVTKYYKFSDDLPSISEIQHLVAGYPDEEALIGIIMRSYDYIQKLPLQGISEDYAQITAL
jgi:hypothetical protein